MIEVKDKVEPFVIPVIPITEDEPENVVEPITSTPPPLSRSTTSIEEDEDDTKDDCFETRSAASYLPAYNEYLKELRGDGLNFGDY